MTYTSMDVAGNTQEAKPYKEPNSQREAAEISHVYKQRGQEVPFVGGASLNFKKEKGNSKSQMSCDSEQQRSRNGKYKESFQTIEHRNCGLSLINMKKGIISPTLWRAALQLS